MIPVAGDAILPPHGIDGMSDARIDYALLIGQGRSGTNWLLQLFDQSARTHCRNEPDQGEGSALRGLAPFRFFVDDEAALDALWDDAIRAAALSMGPRDHRAPHAKAWLLPGSRRLGYSFLRQRYLLRSKLGGGLPMDAPEVRFPRWMTTPARLERAFHVFKLNAAVGVAEWALRRRPDARVLHIVRHPGGFVRSWHARWVRGEGHQQRAAAGKDELLDEARLVALAERSPEWAATLGDIGAMSPLEAELWWWRYCNEHLLGVGRERPGYRVVVFEELARDPVGVAEAVYRFCGLDWTAAMPAHVSGASHGARDIADAWRDQLDAETVATVERVLAGSELARLWNDGGPA